MFQRENYFESVFNVIKSHNVPHTYERQRVNYQTLENVTVKSPNLTLNLTDKTISFGTVTDDEFTLSTAYQLNTVKKFEVSDLELRDGKTVHLISVIGDGFSVFMRVPKKVEE